MSNERRRLSGVVTKAKMTKTVTVRVDRDSRHPLYEKVVRSSKNYLAHDEIGCRPGDEVIIVESRPISKTKRWVVQEIVRQVTPAEVEAERGAIVDETEALEEAEGDSQ